MIRTLIIVMLAAASPLRAAPAADGLIHDGITAFTNAYRAWDADGFATAAGHFRKAAAANPKSAIARYWLGAAQFHRMLKLQSLPNAKAHARTADAAMEEAIKALETAVALDPKHAESHALLGTLYGMKIQGGMLRAMRFGPRVQEHQKHALASGPKNPRVRYLLGTGQFHTAKNAAGFREALNTLLYAEKLFVAEAKSPPKAPAPTWGSSSCLTFIGRSYLKLGEKDHAATYFRRALAAHPADHIAKQELARLKAN
jgi:tetratricopeptide (TPR) repeat protein